MAISCACFLVSSSPPECGLHAQTRLRARPTARSRCREDAPGSLGFPNSKTRGGLVDAQPLLALQLQRGAPSAGGEALVTEPSPAWAPKPRRDVAGRAAAPPPVLLRRLLTLTSAQGPRAPRPRPSAAAFREHARTCVPAGEANRAHGRAAPPGGSRVSSTSGSTSRSTAGSSLGGRRRPGSGPALQLGPDPHVPDHAPPIRPRPYAQATPQVPSPQPGPRPCRLRGTGLGSGVASGTS